MKTAALPSTSGSVLLNGSDVVLYSTKKGEKSYSAIYLNENFGYFLVPLDNPDASLGFWAKFSDCKVLFN